jgi:hypothetical protein
MVGVGLVIFGLIYPHFVRTHSWIEYLYASPFGLVPCPTLSVIIGATLMARARSHVWDVTLSVVGLLYGMIGVFRLGVGIDYGLIVGALTLAVSAAIRTREVVRWTDDRNARAPSPVVDGHQASAR